MFDACTHLPVVGDCNEDVEECVTTTLIPRAQNEKSYIGCSELVDLLMRTQIIVRDNLED